MLIANFGKQYAGTNKETSAEIKFTIEQIANFPPVNLTIDKSPEQIQTEIQTILASEIIPESEKTRRIEKLVMRNNHHYSFRHQTLAESLNVLRANVTEKDFATVKVYFDNLREILK